MFLDKYIDGGWTLAIRPRVHGEELFLEEGKRPFEVIKNPWRYWCADPFLFCYQGTEYIFCEAFDILRDRGILAYRTIDESGKTSKLTPCLDLGFHISYPFVFAVNDDVYMIPETGEANQVQLYRAVDFPNKWEKCANLISGAAACDTNFLDYQGQQYLFSLIYDKSAATYVYDKLYAYRWDGESFVPLSATPVVRGTQWARNAGAMFVNDGELFRVSQNCSAMYGENISFHRVLALQEDYREELMCKIGVTDINLRQTKPYDGIHTYNMDEQYEIVDLQRKKWFRIERMVYLVCNKFKSIFENIDNPSKQS